MAEEEQEFQLTDEQISEIRDAFNMYDKERKGEIPTSILGTVMKNLGHNLKPDQLAECIDAVDGDGSGTVDFDEFLALMAKKTKEAEDERELREVFRVFDKNSRGVIDVADLKMIFKALDPDMPDDEVEQIISEVDEDGSGTVDYEEFYKLMTEKSFESLHALYFDQLKIRSGADDTNNNLPEAMTTRNQLQADVSLVKENEVLRTELLKMKMYIADIQKTTSTSANKRSLRKTTFFSSMSKTLGKLNPFKHGSKDTSNIDDGALDITKPRRRRFSIS